MHWTGLSQCVPEERLRTACEGRPFIGQHVGPQHREAELNLRNNLDQAENLQSEDRRVLLLQYTQNLYKVQTAARRTLNPTR